MDRGAVVVSSPIPDGVEVALVVRGAGTPFRAITNGEFTEDQIFNWTYTDEQHAKESWDKPQVPNPYIDLPQMAIYSYDIGADAEEWAAEGEFDGFTLNEYFKAKRVNPQSKSMADRAH